MGSLRKTSTRTARAWPHARIEDLLAATDDCVVVLDEAWRFVFVNARARNELGAGPLLGSVIWDCFPNVVGSEFELCYRRAAKSGTPQTFEAFFPPLNSWYDVRAVPLGGRLVVFFRNVTERHISAERAVRENSQRYRLAAKATNDAIWDWNLETDQIDWNEAVVRLAGEQPGRDDLWWKERIHPEDVGRVLGIIERLLAGHGEHWQAEYRFRRSDGSYAHVLDRGYVIRKNGRPVRMVGAMADLTERVRAQRRISELQSELIHATRVTMIGTMASALAHEINQPLTAAGNYTSAAKLLLEGAADPRAGLARENIDKAAGETMRAGEIIRGLRRMVERREVDMEPVELRPLVGEAIMLALPKARLAEVGVAIRVPPQLQVQADPVQVQQVLINLVRNAAEAMAGCATRELTVAAEALSDEVVRIKVADTGPGIAPDQREKLFAAFSTTKDQGLGVGLSICRTIIEAHGGRIWFEERTGPGATFCFTLRRLPAGPSL